MLQWILLVFEAEQLLIVIYQVFLPWESLAYNLILTSTIQTVSVSNRNQQQANSQANSGNNMDPTDA